jgi:hypothetical protein
MQGTLMMMMMMMMMMMTEMFPKHRFNTDT